jgi:hypothetical protein
MRTSGPGPTACTRCTASSRTRYPPPWRCCCATSIPRTGTASTTSSGPLSRTASRTAATTASSTGTTGCDADEAFQLLRRSSQRANLKLNEIARRLVDAVGTRLWVGDETRVSLDDFLKDPK